MRANVILVDDDQDALISLQRSLGSKQLEAKIHATVNPQRALQMAEACNPEAAVIDLSLDEIDGVESGFRLLKSLIGLVPSCRVIVLTGHGSHEYGVRALDEGAASFLEKPADISHLAALIQDGISQAQLRRSYDALAEQHLRRTAHRVIGNSAAMQALKKELAFAAATGQAVLLTGETGTGKGLCARTIHAMQRKKSGEFVRYQPSYAGAEMVSSDLFGHCKGAFTGAVDERDGLLLQAHQGTLFLDEVDEIPHQTQVLLLDALQEKCFRPLGSNKEIRSSFRLIAATNRGIQECLEEKRLREDFFHRIAHLHIHLPPLRERLDDIDELAHAFLERMRLDEEVSVLSTTPAALSKLKEHHWPGNVRELHAVVTNAAYAAAFGKRRHIEVEDIRVRSFNAQSPSTETNAAAYADAEAAIGSFHEQVQLFRVQLINRALQAYQGNQAAAARSLGIDRSTLRRVLGST